MKNDSLTEFTYSLNKTLDFKKFLVFSIFIYPLAITINLLPQSFLGKTPIVWYLVSYLIFAGLNILWSQKKFSFTLILLSIVLGIPWLAFTLNGFDNTKSLDLFSAIVLYLIMLPVFLLSQFTAWTPSIIKLYSSINKPKALTIFIVVILSISGYVCLAILTKTIVGSPSFR